MTPRYGIDTSVLVRPATGHPEPSFEHSVTTLRALIENEGAEVFASNQVIGEAYVAIQRQCGISKVESRAGLLEVLQSGLVAPLNGVSVIAALDASRGAGLLDRLIANDYARTDLSVPTLDERIAALPCPERSSKPRERNRSRDAWSDAPSAPLTSAGSSPGDIRGLAFACGP